MRSFHTEPGGCLKAILQVPADKSISHRAVMLAAFASGTSIIKNFLQGEDNLHTIKALQALNVPIEIKDNTLTVRGVKKEELKPANLYLGNSGTAIRLLTGLLAGQGIQTELTGDASLSKRPMQRVIEPLTQMGAKIHSNNGLLPLIIAPSNRLKGIHYKMPMASAQVKSALLLAGLFAENKTVVTEPGITRDHTERLLQSFGYSVETDGRTVSVEGGGRLCATNMAIPSDFSSAAFFMVGACIAPDSKLTLREVGVNPTRIGAFNILKKMGASIRLENQRFSGREPVADIVVESSSLQGIEIDPVDVPLAIDEFPILFVAAACARGKTIVRGAAELRVKESDRIAAMARGLLKLGIKVQELTDGIIIEGGQFQGGTINSEGDHRIAMAFAMASCRAKKPIHIHDCNNVSTSFPNFVELAKLSGVKINVK